MRRLHALLAVGVLAAGCGQNAGFDPTPFGLTILEPARGVFIDAAQHATVDVKGVVHHHRAEKLVIDGQAVAISADGSFSTTLTPQTGINIITAKLDGQSPVTQARSFLYGHYAPTDSIVPSGLALRVNTLGFDHYDGLVDDVASLAQAALRDRNIIASFPSSYPLSVPVVGTVTVQLVDKSADPAQVMLAPQPGGVVAQASFPNLFIRFDAAFGCLFTTCHVTGTVGASSAQVTMPIRMSLKSGAVDAAHQSANVALNDFYYTIDGALGGVEQAIINALVPDLKTKLQDLAAQKVTRATPGDIGFALSQLAVPTRFSLPQPMNATLDWSQSFDLVDCDGGGCTIAIATRVSGTASGMPLPAPGFLWSDSHLGAFDGSPPFAVSASLDALNQMLHALWSSHGLEKVNVAGATHPAGFALGPVILTASLPPVMLPGPNGSLQLGVGDLLLDTTIDGMPLRVAVSLVADVTLAVDPAHSVASLKLAETPKVAFEVLSAGALPELLMPTLQTLAPTLVGNLVGAISVPLPNMSLDAVSATLAGTTLHLAAPVQAGVDPASARLNLYGGFIAN